MYQAVTKADTAAYVVGRQDGSLSANDYKVTFRGSQADDFVDEVEDALERVLAGWRARDASKDRLDQARDELEGQLSQELHIGFEHLPASVLTDKDFWRFCSAYLYDFIVWRQPSNAVTALLPYFGAASNGLGRECVPHRMFDRAQIVKTGGDLAGDPDPYSLARFGAADVWKSHILRVANGNAPVVVREMLTDVKTGKLKTHVVRTFVKNLRRARSNVLFEVLNQPQARDLVDRERARTLSSAATLDSDGGSD
ncbi:hypothetical protein [Mycolicibacterium obuense]|uniref:Uncharacterized protein n=1 Tax=Mycolicibacterium obuense TaxID=1807 RepID=A0A0J6VXQ9_9MYCO|nr:hypothetical protein [Mycolicibacterium obuense]KMO75870.1 hypothetical protein MOBUDSM44075_02399 [Mycolicibacterium obuense]